MNYNNAKIQEGIFFYSYGFICYLKISARKSITTFQESKSPTWEGVEFHFQICYAIEPTFEKYKNAKIKKQYPYRHAQKTKTITFPHFLSMNNFYSNIPKNNQFLYKLYITVFIYHILSLQLLHAIVIGHVSLTVVQNWWNVVLGFCYLKWLLNVYRKCKKT